MERLYTLAELVELTGLHAATIYRQIDRGLFPKPLKIGRVNRWRDRDLKAWLDQLDKATEAALNP